METSVFFNRCIIYDSCILYMCFCYWPWFVDEIFRARMRRTFHSSWPQKIRFIFLAYS